MADPVKDSVRKAMESTEYTIEMARKDFKAYAPELAKEARETGTKWASAIAALVKRDTTGKAAMAVLTIVVTATNARRNNYALNEDSKMAAKEFQKIWKRDAGEVKVTAWRKDDAGKMVSENRYPRTFAEATQAIMETFAGFKVETVDDKTRKRLVKNAGDTIRAAAVGYASEKRFDLPSVNAQREPDSSVTVPTPRIMLHVGKEAPSLLDPASEDDVRAMVDAWGDKAALVVLYIFRTFGDEQRAKILKALAEQPSAAKLAAERAAADARTKEQKAKAG